MASEEPLQLCFLPNISMPSEELLPETVSELSAEVRVLRDAVDELREVLQWMSRNPTSGVPTVLLRSMAEGATSDQLKNDVPAIVGQRIAAEYAGEIARLQTLLSEVIDCPELNPDGELQPITRQILVEIDSALNEPIETEECDTKEASLQSHARPKGRLF